MSIATLKGERELRRLLTSLGDKVAKKGLRAAVSAGATPVVKSAKRRTPKDSGLLKKALGKKVAFNAKRQSAAAIVGARKSVQGVVKGKVRKPSRYLHLVDRPHIGPDGRYVPGHPILEPALAESEGQSIDAMAGKLKDVVEREAMKGVR